MPLLINIILIEEKKVEGHRKLDHSGFTGRLYGSGTRSTCVHGSDDVCRYCEHVPRGSIQLKKKRERERERERRKDRKGHLNRAKCNTVCAHRCQVNSTFRENALTSPPFLPLVLFVVTPREQ